jgi:hypothetical protein
MMGPAGFSVFINKATEACSAGCLSVLIASGLSGFALDGAVPGWGNSNACGIRLAGEILFVGFSPDDLFVSGKGQC